MTAIPTAAAAASSAALTPAEAGAYVRDAFRPVVKLPLSGPDGLRTPHYGLFLDSGESVGRPVSALYCPHQPDDVAAMAEAVATAFDDRCRVTARWFGDAHQLIIGPTDATRRALFGTADAVFPRFVCTAGYNGEAFRASFGMYRDACRNLLIIQPVDQRERVSVKLRHTSGLRRAMPELIRSFRQLASRWASVTETVETMRAREVELGEFLRAVYPVETGASDRKLTIARDRARAIARRIDRERQQLGGSPLDYRRPLVSAWEAYNGVQGYVQHDQRRKGSPDQVTRALVALGDAAVGRALEAALAA